MAESKNWKKDHFTASALQPRSSLARNNFASPLSIPAYSNSQPINTMSVFPSPEKEPAQEDVSGDSDGESAYDSASSQPLVRSSPSRAEKEDFSKFSDSDDNNRDTGLDNSNTSSISSDTSKTTTSSSNARRKTPSKSPSASSAFTVRVKNEDRNPPTPAPGSKELRQDFHSAPVTAKLNREKAEKSGRQSIEHNVLEARSPAKRAGSLSTSTSGSSTAGESNGSPSPRPKSVSVPKPRAQRSDAPPPISPFVSIIHALPPVASSARKTPKAKQPSDAVPIPVPRTVGEAPRPPPIGKQGSTATNTKRRATLFRTFSSSVFKETTPKPQPMQNSKDSQAKDSKKPKSRSTKPDVPVSPARPGESAAQTEARRQAAKLTEMGNQEFLKLRLPELKGVVGTNSGNDIWSERSSATKKPMNNDEDVKNHETSKKRHKKRKRDAESEEATKADQQKKDKKQKHNMSSSHSEESNSPVKKKNKKRKRDASPSNEKLHDPEDGSSRSAKKAKKAKRGKDRKEDKHNEPEDPSIDSESDIAYAAKSKRYEAAIDKESKTPLLTPTSKSSAAATQKHKEETTHVLTSSASDPQITSISQAVSSLRSMIHPSLLQNAYHKLNAEYDNWHGQKIMQEVARQEQKQKKKKVGRPKGIDKASFETTSDSTVLLKPKSPEDGIVVLTAARDMLLILSGGRLGLGTDIRKIGSTASTLVQSHVQTSTPGLEEELKRIAEDRRKEIEKLQKANQSLKVRISRLQMDR